VVLKIHVVRQGGHGYYVEDLVPGRAEGSRVAGEEPGAWVGAGARALGLSGPVGSPTFTEVLEGRHPGSGRALRSVRGERSVAGYDLTFCAPKSVSLLHLLAPREMAEAAGSGHQRAVADALEYLGREALGVRRTRARQVSFLPTTGPVAGQFLHRTSRALDPHLHTHVVVANVAQGVDGLWSGVDSRRLHAHLAAAQSLYHARLRFELGDRMGAAWRIRPSGLGDIVGVDPRLCRLFSRRTASMDEYRRLSGSGGERAGPWTSAFHADRPDKDRSVTVDGLRVEWKQRAVDLGFDLGDLTRAVGVRRRPDELVVDGDALRRNLLGLSGEHRSLGRRHLVAALAAATEGGGEARHVEMVAARLMAACSPRSGPGGTGRGVAGDPWAADPRLDPVQVVRVVDGLRPDGPWRVEGRSAVTGPSPAGPDTAPLVGMVAARRVDGVPGRPHQVDEPTALPRSLGIER
jgi:conjugative relaxase-like TrwC/TraI family protein